MEEQPIQTQSVTNVVPLRVADGFPPGLEDVIEQTLRITVGLLALAAEALADVVAQTLGAPAAPADADLDRQAAAGGALPLLVGATFGVTTGALRWGAHAATTLVRTGELVLAPVTSSAPFREAVRRLGSELEALDARWREERPREEEAASAFLRTLVPEIVDAVLDQIDLDAIVAERVDLDRVVERVDLDAAVQRVDLDVVVDRVPLDAIVARIDLDQIVERVDLQRIVDRIDVDAVASRLDVEAVVHRLDLAAIAREVIDELDLHEIIRESMGSMTTETVGGIRVQSMNADRAITRLVDRVLRRRHPVDDVPEDQA